MTDSVQKTDWKKERGQKREKRVIIRTLTNNPQLLLNLRAVGSFETTREKGKKEG